MFETPNMNVSNFYSIASLFLHYFLQSYHIPSSLFRSLFVCHEATKICNYPRAKGPAEWFSANVAALRDLSAMQFGKSPFIGILYKELGDVPQHRVHFTCHVMRQPKIFWLYFHEVWTKIEKKKTWQIGWCWLWDPLWKSPKWIRLFPHVLEI